MKRAGAKASAQFAIDYYLFWDYKFLIIVFQFTVKFRISARHTLVMHGYFEPIGIRKYFIVIIIISAISCRHTHTVCNIVSVGIKHQLAPTVIPGVAADKQH